MTGRRQDQGLFPELIEQALQEHARLPLRGERHSNYQEFFVDSGQLEHLKTSDWQVVFGRRGTGKTFLLGTLHEQAREKIDTWGVLSIRLTLQDAVASPIGRQVDDKIRALGYFEMFLQGMVEELLTAVDQIMGLEGPTGQAWGKRVKKHKKLIENATLDVLHAVQMGGGVAAFDRTSKQSVYKRDSVAQRSGGVSARGSTNALDRPEVAAGFEFAASRNTSDERHMAQTVDHEVVPRFGQVRRHLLRLLELLEVEFLEVLIDEWTVLDPTGLSGIQPTFAECLKRTFAGTGKISLKFAANRYQARFSNRSARDNYQGLELGADLFEAFDLDRVRGNSEQVGSFLSTLLFKRLLRAEPRMARFLRPGEEVADEQFLRSIFRDDRAFRELVSAAEGNVRDFLVLFNELCRRRQCSVRPTWTVRDIRDVAFDQVVRNRLQDVEFESLADQLLNKGIRAVVDRTESRTFLVEDNAGAPMDNALDELLEKRLIHPCPKRYLDPSVAVRYRAFLLGHAFWVDWAQNKSEAPRGADSSDTWALVGEQNVAQYVIPSSILETDRIQCPRCGDVFAPQERSFVMKQLCPSCFEPVVGDTQGQTPAEITGDAPSRKMP